VIRARAEGLAGLVLGLGLAAAYAMLARDLAVGPAEFAYAPFVPDSLPWGPMRGFTWEQLWDHVYRVVVLGPAVVLLSIAAHRLAPVAWVATIDPRRLAVGASAFGLAAMAFGMLVVLRGRAIVDDELAYAMQAGFFTDGRLLAKDVGYFPAGAMAVLAGPTYTSKYLFGEGLVQTLGTLVDRPALLHLPLAALGLTAFYFAVRAAAGAAIAGWSTAFVAIGPMFVMTDATGMTQGSALACVMLAALGVAWCEGGRPRAGAVLVAAALGFCAMVRPQTALPAGAVLGGAASWRLVRRRDGFALLLLGAIGLAALGVIGAYDRAVTGWAFELPWSLQCNPERYGFGYVWRWSLYRHTLLAAIENLGVVAVRFNAWWLGWPAGLAVLVVWRILGRPARGLPLWAAVGGAVVAFELPYYSTGISETGPIYHFELLLPAAVLAANTAVAALDRWPKAAAATLLAHLVFGTGSFFVVQTARLERLVTTIHADADAALARIEGRAVLLYETRNSEVLRLGWVMADFPRQYRSDRDRVVTYSRPTRERLEPLLAAYPGRSCWYYHRDPLSERAELLTCDEAKSYLDRPFIDDLRYRDVWVRPTAFKRTGYDPYGDLRRTEMHPLPRPCCALEELRRSGAPIENPSCDP
jgi:hypothetical protein